MHRYLSASVLAVIGAAAVAISSPAAADPARLPWPISNPAHLDYFCASASGHGAGPAPAGYFTALDAVITTAKRLGEHEAATLQALATVSRCDSLAAWRAGKGHRAAAVGAR